MTNYKTLALVATITLFGASNLALAVEFEPDLVEQTYAEEADQSAPQSDAMSSIEPAAGSMASETMDGAPLVVDFTSTSDETFLPYQ